MSVVICRVRALVRAAMHVRASRRLSGGVSRHAQLTWKEADELIRCRPVVAFTKSYCGLCKDLMGGCNARRDKAKRYCDDGPGATMIFVFVNRTI
jgi:hypothetical protein